MDMAKLKGLEEAAKALTSAVDEFLGTPCEAVIIQFPVASRVVRTIEVDGGAVDLVESEQRPSGDVFGMVAPIDAPDPVGDKSEPDGALWALLRGPDGAPIGSDAGDEWRWRAVEVLAAEGYGLWDARA